MCGQSNSEQEPSFSHSQVVQTHAAKATPSLSYARRMERARRSSREITWRVIGEEHVIERSRGRITNYELRIATRNSLRRGEQEGVYSHGPVKAFCQMAKSCRSISQSGST